MMGDVTLTEFLLARVAEDEATARAAKEEASIPWRATYGRQVEQAIEGYLVTPEDEYALTTDPPEDVALHIARHDPERVLAECSAKRRIAERLEGLIGDRPPASSSDEDGWVLLAWETLYDLASLYADHPDYRDEWRP